MSLSIAAVIPAYNVEAHIEEVLKGIPSFVDHIVVVDDASSDATADKIASACDPRVVLVRHASNGGVGAAMVTGYAKAMELRADILVKIDGDGQMRPEYLESLIRPLLEKTADYAKGNRFTHYPALEKMPPLRRLGNAFLSFCVKFTSGYWDIFDVTNGYTAILTETYRRLDRKGIAHGYFFEISLLIELNIAGARVTDIDMPPVYGEEKSHMKIGKVATGFPFLLLRGFFRRFYRRHMVRDFSALTVCALTGAPLFLFGLFYGLNLWMNPPRSGEPTPAGTVMLAALPIIIGFQLLLAALVLDVVSVPRGRRR